jgi:hypothetical protein
MHAGSLLDRDPLGELADPGGMLGRVGVVSRPGRNAMRNVGDSVGQADWLVDQVRERLPHEEGSALSAGGTAIDLQLRLVAVGSR